MKRFLVFLLMFYLVNLSAQDINTTILQQVESIRSGRTARYAALDQHISKSPNAVLKALGQYQNDDSENVRLWTYEQYNRILTLHEKPQTMRQEIVLLLIEGLADSYYSVRTDCVDYLTECKLHDFQPFALEQFNKQFNSKAWFSKELVLLAGFIGNDSCRVTLEELANSTLPSHRRLLWHVNLALARMGDNYAGKWCLSQIEFIGINDDVTNELLPGLIYTRQRRSFEFLITVLNSDDKLCSSNNPDSNEPMLCGYRVMEYLAPAIKNYPLKQLPSGDIETKDYHKALLTTREWFSKKNGTFEILLDSF